VVLWSAGWFVGWSALAKSLDVDGLQQVIGSIHMLATTTTAQLRFVPIQASLVSKGLIFYPFLYFFFPLRPLVITFQAVLFGLQLEPLTRLTALKKKKKKQPSFEIPHPQARASMSALRFRCQLSHFLPCYCYCRFCLLVGSSSRLPILRNFMRFLPLWKYL